MKKYPEIVVYTNRYPYISDGIAWIIVLAAILIFKIILM